MENKEIFWQGEDGLTWRATLGIDNAIPCIFDLSYKTNGAWVNLAANLHPEFKVITGVRTKINPQREKGLAPGETLDFQWDTYSDDPMSRKKEVEEAKDSWNTTEMTFSQNGGEQIVAFNGLTVGKFSGGFEVHFYNGCNLVRIEAVASTQEDGVCYLYHGGLSGFKPDKLYYVTPKRR